jgi:hypothetical protein
VYFSVGAPYVTRFLVARIYIPFPPSIREWNEQYQI